MARRHRGARLEMTSLMDVMFLVLVFFIYCIFDMAVHKGVKVDLPQADGTKENGERLLITIRANNSFQLNGVDIARDTLLSKLAMLHHTSLDFPVLISADREASLGVGIELLADLKKIGFEHASFHVRAPQESRE